jgi:hypothetical protein
MRTKHLTSEPGSEVNMSLFHLVASLNRETDSELHSETNMVVYKCIFSTSNNVEVRTIIIY